jgi:hypothetical protein
MIYKQNTLIYSCVAILSIYDCKYMLNYSLLSYDALYEYADWYAGTESPEKTAAAILWVKTDPKCEEGYLT